MRVETIPIDSSILGGAVLAIHDFEPDAGFGSFERAYVSEHHPLYATCKVPLDRIASIHALEEAGFRLVECQIESGIKLRQPYDVAGFDYDFLRVTREEELEEVLAIAASAFVHDRLSMDPAIGPELSGIRYRRYVLNSFRSPDEAVYRLMERASGRVVAFKTHRYVSATQVLFLLGAVHPNCLTAGLGVINEYFEFNELIRRGIRRGITHISAANHAVFNLEIGKLGFRVLGTAAVLRKIYGGGVRPQQPPSPDSTV